MNIFNDGIIQLYCTENDSAKVKRTILIIGQARAGSTMVSSILNQMGIPIGNNFGPVHEDNDLGKYVQDLKSGTSPDGFRREIKKRNKLYSKWAWKRPDMYEIIHCFIKRIRNPFIIAVLRDPVSIASRNIISLEGNDGSLQCQESILIQNAINEQSKILEKINELKLPTFMISYEKVLSNPILFIQSLSKFVGASDLNFNIEKLASSVKPNHTGYSLRARLNEFVPESKIGMIKGILNEKLLLKINNFKSEIQNFEIEIHIDGVKFKNISEILVDPSSTIEIEHRLNQKLIKNFHSITVNFIDDGEEFSNSPFIWIK